MHWPTFAAICAHILVFLALGGSSAFMESMKFVSSGTFWKVLFYGLPVLTSLKKANKSASTLLENGGNINCVILPLFSYLFPYLHRLAFLSLFPCPCWPSFAWAFLAGILTLKNKFNVMFDKF